MISFKGAHVAKDIILVGGAGVRGLPVELSSCGRIDGRAWRSGRPRDHQPLGTQVQPAPRRGVPSLQQLLMSDESSRRGEECQISWCYPMVNSYFP